MQQLIIVGFIGLVIGTTFGVLLMGIIVGGRGGRKPVAYRGRPLHIDKHGGGRFVWGTWQYRDSSEPFPLGYQIQSLVVIDELGATPN